MKNRVYEIYFLNPKSSLVSKIQKYIIRNGFEEIKSDEENYNWKYQKGNVFVEVALCEDYIGPYIIMICEGLSINSLRQCLAVCPECGSNDLQVSILFCWRNSITEQLFAGGRLNYIPGAYDRHGTYPETHTCIDCGCKWHNMAEIFYWNEIIKQGGVLTQKELGIIDTKKA